MTDETNEETIVATPEVATPEEVAAPEVTPEATV